MKLNPLQRLEFLKLINSIGYQNLHLIDSCVIKLKKMGIDSEEISEPRGLMLDGIIVKAYKTIDDEDGIYAIDLLITVINSEKMSISSKMNGRGFKFFDLLEKVAKFWNVDVKELPP